jgi:hypothetical protein
MRSENLGLEALDKEYPIRTVAVIDMLGSKARVRNIRDQPDAFWKMKNMVENLGRVVRNIEKQSGKFAETIGTLIEDLGGGSAPDILRRLHSGLMRNKDSIKCIMMSDTIIMYGPPDNDTAYNIVYALSDFARYCILNDVLLRGAVVRGRFYHRGTSMFGLGFIEAYELESQVAKSPRIVITKPICDLQWLHNDPTHAIGIDYDPTIRKDSDGLYYINTFRADDESRLLALSDGTLSLSFFRPARAKLVKLVGEAKSIEHWTKVAWVVSEFNRTVTAFPEWNLPAIEMDTFDQDH